jgi:hypothetical protein
MAATDADNDPSLHLSISPLLSLPRSPSTGSTTMPCVSEKNKFLSKIDTLKLDVMTQRKENLQRRANEEEYYDSEDEDQDPIFLSPLTPSPPSSLILDQIAISHGSHSTQRRRETSNTKTCLAHLKCFTMRLNGREF